MKIVVCIRQGLDGEINPFDACAYETALNIPGAEIILLSMGPDSVKNFLLPLTRLGATKAVLLSSKAFAGADTLATAYTLSRAIERLKPDLIFCGRQTLVGDTAQVGPMLSVYANTNLITNVMSVDEVSDEIVCTTRTMGVQSAKLPALITVERINTLRRPSIRSKVGSVEVWSAEDIGADATKCGLAGSPTRVLKTYENTSGKRKCRFISLEELKETVSASLEKESHKVAVQTENTHRLSKVVLMGEAPRIFAQQISDDITVLPLTNEEDIVLKLKELEPNAVLWASDSKSKELAARVSAIMNLGLCADCTALETDGEQMIMYRPALSGSIIAKIISLTKPAMATVRTESNNIKDVVVAMGYGAKDSLNAVKTLAKKLNAMTVATRKMVDNGYLPYDMQVGLTGKTVSPPVYITVGVSGAVHHIVGMERSGTVIAINPDKDAPIFDYADYGILATAEELNEFL